MSDSPHDRPLTPDQRRREVASILAKGVFHLHSMAPAALEPADSGPGDDAPEPQESGLEVSATTRPHVTNG